jgi:hypothetical protein
MLLLPYAPTGGGPPPTPCPQLSALVGMEVDATWGRLELVKEGLKRAHGEATMFCLLALMEAMR